MPIVVGYRSTQECFKTDSKVEWTGASCIAYIVTYFKLRFSKFHKFKDCYQTLMEINASKEYNFVAAGGILKCFPLFSDAFHNLRLPSLLVLSCTYCTARMIVHTL